MSKSSIKTDDIKDDMIEVLEENQQLKKDIELRDKANDELVKKNLGLFKQLNQLFELNQKQRKEIKRLNENV